MKDLAAFQVSTFAIGVGRESRDYGLIDLVSGRNLRELQLVEPIRYSLNDPIESWMNRLLCLDATTVPSILTGCPHPNDCQLYHFVIFTVHIQYRVEIDNSKVLRKQRHTVFLPQAS